MHTSLEGGGWRRQGGTQCSNGEVQIRQLLVCPFSNDALQMSEVTHQTYRFSVFLNGLPNCFRNNIISCETQLLRFKVVLDLWASLVTKHECYIRSRVDDCHLKQNQDSYEGFFATWKRQQVRGRKT